jgi:hypothetical protein
VRFGKALAEVVSKAGISYGYTLAVWSTGAICAGRFGLPDAREVFLFLAGGTLAYGGLALAVGRGRVLRAARPPAALWENVLAVPAVGAAYGLDRLVPSADASFFLSPFVATLVYLVGLAALVSRVMAREVRPVRVLRAPPGPRRRPTPIEPR